MKTRTLFNWLVILCTITLGGGMVRSGQAFARATTATCGEDHDVCGDDEKCCEHRVATFCQDQSCSSVHVEGECIPKEHRCDDFWCGNRQCQTTWLMSKDVCCIYYTAGDTPEYACTASEVSCRGNTSRLTIRPTPTLASSDLSGN
jgi:hypothetical protein